jgi:hypothetical protein
MVGPKKRIAGLKSASLPMIVAIAWAWFTGSGFAQVALQQGFEGREPLWVQGPTDAQPKEVVHATTTDHAHSGQKAEGIAFTAERGTFVHFHVDPGKALVAEDLNCSVWFRANRPGMALMVRVVLPRERDPKNLEQPLTVMVPADTYQLSGRWQQLALRQPMKKLRDQVQLARADLKRDLIIQDAYMDRIVLNLYAGPGVTETWIDDLEVSPLMEAAQSSPKAEVHLPDSKDAPTKRATGSAKPAEVILRGNSLQVAGERFFMRGMRHSGTPVKTLRDAGFNTLWLNSEANESVVEEAAKQGFLLVPSVEPQPEDLTGAPANLTSASGLGRKMSRFLEQDSVLAWNLGNNLPSEDSGRLASLARSFHASDPGRPVAVDVWDGFGRYSRSIEQVMLGMHRWPLYTGMELTQYRDWLMLRRQFASPGTYTWTWIQTHLPDWYVKTAYRQDPNSPFQEPVGPTPEQIRLMTYIAMGSGMRGIGYWSDKFLSDSHSGRDRLLALALLNLEISLLEPLLVTGEEPRWIDTSNPQVKAAVMRCDKHYLIMPVWFGDHTQFVPSQGAVHGLRVVVPHAPVGTSAWEISPGGVRSLPWQRKPGGMEVLVRDFHMATAIVVTSDLSPTGPVVRFQEQQRRVARTAAQWSGDQAAESMTKTRTIVADLKQIGHGEVDADQLLERAQKSLDLSASYRRNGEHNDAYSEAQRVMRPLRILMRSHWEKAMRELDTPLATPWSGSFNTLPRHWQFMDRLRGLRIAENVLPGGEFESAPDVNLPGWTVQEDATLDDVVVGARRVDNNAHTGKQCLMLRIQPKDPKNSPVALERALVAIHTPAMQLPPGMPVRISAWIQVPKPLMATGDGALLFDSAAGEPMAIRLHSTPGWRQVTLYREVPESGKIHLTLALTGLGTAYFDDVKIEPLLDPNDSGPNPLSIPAAAKAIPLPTPAAGPTVPLPAPTPPAASPQPVANSNAGAPRPINQPNNP